MEGIERIARAVSASGSTSLLTRYIESVNQQTRTRVFNMHADDASQAWEGEGGAIIDAVP